MYGITREQYDTTVIAQNGVCAICRRHCSSGKRLSVDHHHSSGRVRGLLCGRCNLGIGQLNDDPAQLRAAADYLEKS